MQPAVLLGLLGATMVAAVSSMPVDNRNHNEEMVTRCIIEVLSNALLKSNAPPITPECRQALKKSGKEVKDEEKSENEKTRFKVRLLRDQADASEAHRPSSREDTGDPEEAGIQGLSVANTEGGGHSREGAGEPQGSLHPSESQVSKEAKTYHPEKSEGEDGEEEEGEKYPKREHGEGGSEEKHLEEPGETQNAFLDKRNQAAAKKKEEIMSRYNTHSARLPEEKTHSRERSSQESREETRNPEKHSESKSQSGSQEDSEESEEDASHEMDKRHWRPRHHHGRSRPDRSSQERNLPPEERGQPHAESEEPNVGMASLGDKRDRYPTHYRASEEEPEYGEVVRSYIGVPAPENLEGGRYGARGNEKYGAPRPPSDASQEEDRRTPPNAELDNMAYGYEYSYDWWERKPFEEDVNWGYEKRNLVPKLDLKRQYDRVAQLDQLLHFRKKSAEFPDFYDPEEPLSPHHEAEGGKDRAGPGVLTEEEEKELENLAAMDLELQKIAEKFSGNRRG
uniref:Secretogranin-1 n=1 Tax=Myotis myotis TaxID=51298 RepID=A0A7J7VX32_MYOMY|nr:chromogranin B [Myotis myotis]